MSALTDRLTAYGADMAGALERFVGDDALYDTCFAMFLDDENFAALGDALSREDYTAAFDAAYTLKGVAANLGLTPLYNTVCTVVESLRRKDYTDLAAQYRAVADAKSALEALR